MKRLALIGLLILVLMAACSSQETVAPITETTIPTSPTDAASSPTSEPAPAATAEPVSTATAEPVSTATAEPVATATAEPAPTEPPDTSLTIIDALGREVVLPGLPERIVMTGRALFMIADAAYIFPNAAEAIAGTGSTGQGSGNFISLIDPTYAEKETLDRDAGAEQVAALQPDLVIMKSFLADSTGAPIEALGIPVVYVDLETPEQYWRDLAILGQIFGDEARAAEIIDYYQEKVDAIRQTTDGADKPRVLMLNYDDRDGNVAFNVPPLEWLQTTMVEIAGGEPVWQDANPAGGWTQVTLEQIAAWDADQIYVVSYFADPDEVVEGLKSDPNWQAIRALQEGNVYAFPGDLYIWDQPDPRWILGLSWLAGKIHPDLFPDLDIRAEMLDFYQTLYGLDEAFVEENIVPTLRGSMP